MTSLKNKKKGSSYSKSQKSANRQSVPSIASEKERSIRRSFRLVTPFQLKDNTEIERNIISNQQKRIIELLVSEGFVLEPDLLASVKTHSDKANFICQLSHEPFSLGRSLAASFGLIYIQDRSSMLPPLALHPQPASVVLDMCASPGSKTGELAQLLGVNGLVIGNEPGKSRLPVLRANLSHLNLWQGVTSSYKAESYPLSSGCLEHIQLDPPCSGWGTVDKNPKVMELWTLEKTNALVYLQRSLLKEATRLLKPGGRMVYSTCTTNIKENEEQIAWAKDYLGLKLVELPPLNEFQRAESGLLGCDGVWRIDNSGNNLRTSTEQSGDSGQGFFVALLEKTENTQDSQDSLSIEDESLAINESQHHSSRMNHLEFSLNVLSDFGYDISLLPEGKLSVFGREVHFLSQKATQFFMGQSLEWRGLAIAKHGNFGVKALNSLRSLMPSLEFAQKNNQALSLDSVGDIQRLLKGVSLELSVGQADTKYMFLYYKDLPLCRLIKKGTRLLFSE